MNTPDKLSHPNWKDIRYSETLNEWLLSSQYLWPQKGMIKVQFYIDEPDSTLIIENYSKMLKNWENLWVRILSRTEALIQSYGYGLDDINVEEDYFYIRLPVSSIDEGGSWNVMLQSMFGWLLDFEGWEDVGEQGVF